MPAPSHPRRHVTLLSSVLLSSVLLSSVLLSAGTALTAHADWAPNGNRIDPVGGTLHYDRFSAASDGLGGLLINMDVLAINASRVLGNGTIAAGWPASQTITGFASDPVPDGHGGGYIAVSNFTSVAVFHIRADATQDPDWPASGAIVCAIPCAKSLPSVAADGEGGLFVAWTDARHPTAATGGRPRELYAARVTPQGVLAPGWTADGHLFATIPAARPDTTYLSIGPNVADGAGGCFVTAAYTVGGFSYPSIRRDDRFLQHIGFDGALAAGWPVDGLVPPGDSTDGYLDVVADHGGCFANWARVGPGTWSSRVHRLLASGAVAPGWPADGALASEDTIRFNALMSLAADDAGGVYLAVERDTAGGFAPAAIEIRRLDASGSASLDWPAGGRRLPAPPDASYLRTVRLAPSTLGAVFALWTQDEMTLPPLGVRTLAAIRFAPSGEVSSGWPEGGVAVCDTAGYRQNVQLVADGRGAAFVVWNDHRDPNGPINGVDFVARLGPDGRALTSVPRIDPVAVRVFAAPNPFTRRVEIRLALARAGDMGVDVLDVSGRVVRRLLNGPRPAGALTCEWDGRDEASREAAPGLFFIRARHGTEVATARVLRIR